MCNAVQDTIKGIQMSEEIVKIDVGGEKLKALMPVPTEKKPSSRISCAYWKWQARNKQEVSCRRVGG